MSYPIEPQRKARIEALLKALDARILVLDGAMGTAIQELDLSDEDFGGASYDGCNENVNLTRPELIRQIHAAHLEAGADIIETNTFGGTPLVLKEFDLEDQTRAINVAAAEIAVKIAQTHSTPAKPRFVAGSIGPTTKAISVTGGIDFDTLSDHFYQQAVGLWAGGVDYFLIETSQDTSNVKAALIGLGRLFEEKKASLPIAISGTIEPMGTMLAGQSVEALLASVSHVPLLYLGLNCATGPEFMTDHIRSLAQISPFRIACVPNAGLPDEDGNYLETPKMMGRVLGSFVKNNWLNLLGGCCGTRKEHVQAFVELVKDKSPRKPVTEIRNELSGIDYLEVREEMRPILVGERTNVIGSRKFKELISNGEIEIAAEIGSKQIKSGAQILDVCLANPDRDEPEDMHAFLSMLLKKVRSPIMIDSTDEKVVELSLKLCQGKSIINSINLEDGEERFDAIVPLAKKYGAALIVGTIDDDPNQGMGITRLRKLEIAKRSIQLLNDKYDFPTQDIYWDPLVFPCGTGDENYKGSAAETIEGIRLLKRHFPGTKTVLGISNVSFGLPTAGREALNSVFLYHCVQAGLDLALINSQKLLRYTKLTEEEKLLCDDLLYNRGPDPIAKFAAFFRKKKDAPPKPKDNLSLDERLANYILEGSKDGLIADIDLKLKEMGPMQIVNGPLMAGMDEVGKLFNENKLIVAEVLQSAEVMKAAVAHLEPLMEKNESATRGRILLATVKGDVHDIGKNLVEIILANNGFEVINLGIKVPPDKLIEAISEHKPDIVGLSGLLVKSAQQMVATASDFSEAGIHTPILVGGAALSSSFVDRKISKAYSGGTVVYSPDAMSGLDLAKQIVDPEKFKKLKGELEERRTKVQADAAAQKPAAPVKERTIRSTSIQVLSKIPTPDNWDRHVLKNKTPIEAIWNYANPMMLYGRHLGIRSRWIRKMEGIAKNPTDRKEFEEADPKAFGIWEKVERIKKIYRTHPVMIPSAVYQFFLAHAQGNHIVIRDPKTKQELHSIEFPRQDKKPFLCLSDYLSDDPKREDNIAAFAVSIGTGLREEAETLKQKGDYLASHILQVLALESAEAYAEYLHQQIRRSWGFADPPEMTMLERFQGKYHGTRYSFGYPACPRLKNQEILFGLLKPEEIGIELTDGFMMDPEASVSALVFHHPDSSYFSVGRAALEEID